MEHTRIAPSGAPSLPPAMIDTLAHHGLRELLFAPIPKLARALGGFDRDQLGTAIEVMIAMLDAADGDADVQDTGDAEDEALSGHAIAYADRRPGCIASDCGDVSVTEWHTRGRHKDNPGVHDSRLLDEDDEEDDPDTGVEDEVLAMQISCKRGYGPGCELSDPGGCEHDGREEGHDAEREQMMDDVPMLPVYSAEHNIFSDKRHYVGHSNLMTSFQANGSGLFSADTGRTHTRNGGVRQPGIPV